MGKMNNKNWWLQSEQEISRSFNTDPKRGLSEEEAQKRLKKWGHNELLEPENLSPLVLFFNQFSSFIVWVLIVAAIISGVLHEWINALAIIAITILNAFLGFFQEYRAEKSLIALRKMVIPTSKVIREGVLKTLPSKIIVPGDLILIEAGDRIPADGRFIQSFELSAQEAALTGESLPVHKTTHALEAENLSLGDKENMGFLGTAALQGKGHMIVTETGIHTELGKIAVLLHKGDEGPTPLQKRLQKLGFTLIWFCLGIVSIVFIFGFIRGTPLTENLLISISLAVASIPEGLPATVTIALSIGARKMAKRRALIRRLSSVETLGSTSVICTDKTGTLTQNEMTVRSIWINNTFIDVTGSGYNPEGNFKHNQISIDPQDIPGMLMALKIGLLCNNAELYKKNQKDWVSSGDPTEVALLSLAGKAKLLKQHTENENPLLSEIPFDSERKKMSTVRKTGEGPIIFVKGAADIILSSSEFILLNGKVETLSPDQKKIIADANITLASQAFRVLGAAYRPFSEDFEINPSMEEKLIFVALFGMRDTPRPEAKESIKTCKAAGITPVMITGDHKETALAVAKELNLWEKNSLALTGTELGQLGDDELKKIIRNVVIFARTTATDKLRIVQTWKALGEIVAMTGDGVNDAPSLKEADIGIAMGITGTDVTKEASDMVITDDNFASIVNAVEEGRAIYDNMTKFICYLASSNIAEIIVVFFGMLINFTDSLGNSFVPLTAVQILWINLATDGLPAVALGVDPINPQGMKRRPRQPSEFIISRTRALHLFLVSSVIAAGALVACYFGINHQREFAQTMTFTSLVILELVAVQIIRSTYNTHIFSNPFIILAMVTSFLLQLLIIYTPFFQKIFNTVPLKIEDWGILAAITGIAWILCRIINRFFSKALANS